MISFLFIGLGLNSATGYLVHYATYMSARTYLVHDEGSNQPATEDNLAIQKAKEVLERFQLQSFGLSNPLSKISFNRPVESKYEYVGAVFEFDIDLNVFGGGDPAKLISEAFLGREPPRSECLQRVCNQMNDIYSCAEKTHTTAFDNGC